MDQTMVMFLVGQSGVIIAAVAVSYVRVQVAIAKIQVHAVDIESRLADLKIDHKSLARKVDGISRSVAKVEATAENPT